MEKRVLDILEEAHKKGACNNIEKASDLRSLITLLFSPQGEEFCINNSFPTLEMCRQFREEARRYNTFVDDREVQCTNVRRVAIVGNTHAKLDYSGTADVYKVFLLHGAKADITIRDYAVVKVVVIGDGCEMIIDKGETGVLL